MNRKKSRLQPDAIVGDKVLLRAPTSKDRAEFIALNRASRRFHRGLVSPPTTAEQFAAFLKRSNTETSVCVFICLVTDGSIIGAMSLSQIFRGGFQNAYLGYYVGAGYANQGYMTEALELLLRHAFSQLKLHRLEANIQPGNMASIALVKRAGFRKEGYSPSYLKISGRWQDHERWAILAEDWQAETRLRPH
ncbi:MAG TPA: GNAT family protein [Pyrinomonadaceae bacterium]|nr:GNAT family protein [Pyrinomonadaceae bacterium]